VVTTVSSPEKARLARAAGAHQVVNYRTEDAASAVRQLTAEGVDIIVEVAPGANAALDQAVVASNGTISVYASDQEVLPIPVRAAMGVNSRYQFVLVYTEPAVAKQGAIEDIQAALKAAALRVGTEAGLPLHHFPLEHTSDAHAAVEGKVVGKVLIEVSPQLAE
jgi:NADPH2:quinone reductase